MTNENSPNEPDDAGRPGQFRTQIGDENFKFRDAEFSDRKITGAQVVEAAQKQPVEDFVVLQQIKSGEIETLRPTETTDLVDRGVEKFFVIKGDRTQKFVIDGLSMEWPERVLTGLALKTLARKEEEDVELVHEREDTPDQVLDDDDNVDLSERGVERFKTRPTRGAIIIIVDDEPYETNQRVMTANEIIKKAAQKDPETHYLVRITRHGNVSYKNRGDEQIRLRNRMKFQTIAIGPTPVSDANTEKALSVFMNGLRALGYEPQLVSGTANFVVFPYTVPAGSQAGTLVRLGLSVPQDFPHNPPSGPNISPEIHPRQAHGEHPLGRIHAPQIEDLTNREGGSWQYWSRPFRNWKESKRTVAAYMNHIFQLWETQ